MSGATQARRPTGADVARLAGVSPSTVSYVLNDTPSQTIPESTRRRVREAAEKLSYRPSPTARSLRRGRSDVVLGLMPAMRHTPAFQQSFQALGEALRGSGLTLVVHPLPADSAGMRGLWRALTPACVFAFTSLHEDDVRAMHAAGVQVAVACASGATRNPWELTFGGEELGRQQAEHLLGRGHTRIGLALPDAPGADAMSYGRTTGLRRALDARRLPLEVMTLPEDLDAATATLHDWRAATPGTTALAAWNDDVGATLVAAATRLGLAVPGDLAVIGAYDYLSGRLASPALSTVQVDLAGQMQAVAAAIVVALAGEPLPNDQDYEGRTTLLARAST